MSELKFVPQSMLDLWADLGKVQVEGTLLRIPGEGIEFSLTPAVRFLSVLEGDDTHKLTHKVKAEAFVREIGGEVMDDSCLVGDTAYQVQPGFLAETAALNAAQAAKATKKLAPKTAAPAAPPAKPPAAKPVAAMPVASVPVAAVPVTPAADAASQKPANDADLLTQFLLESLD